MCEKSYYGNTLEEFIKYSNPDRFEAIPEAPSFRKFSFAGRTKTFKWNLPADQIMRSDGIICGCRGCIVLCYSITPPCTKMEYGIIDSNYKIRYINAEGTGYHVFSLFRFNTYYIYAHNISSVAIDFKGESIG